MIMVGQNVEAPRSIVVLAFLVRDVVKAPETIHIHCILLSNFLKSHLVKRAYLKALSQGVGKGPL